MDLNSYDALVHRLATRMVTTRSLALMLFARADSTLDGVTIRTLHRRVGKDECPPLLGDFWRSE